MADETPTAEKIDDRRSILERALGLLAEVNAGEGITALLLTLNIFLVLTAYYVIKPVREGLITAMPNGPEYKSYMGGVIAVALLFAVPAYAAVARRAKGNRLVVGVTLFFVSNIVLFYFASFSEVLRTWMGLVFYLWVGIFNMMAVAQFWAFAADVYTEEQGKRLFAIIGIGASSGAFFGSLITDLLAETLGVYQLLLVAAAILAAAAGLVHVVHLRETRAGNQAYLAPDDGGGKDDKKKGGGNPFLMVAKHRYLMLLAAFSLVFTLVNTNGEYMLSVLASDHANTLAEAGELGEGVSIGDFLTGFYGNFFLYVNLLGIVFQMFVVSRLVKMGMNVAFLVFPILALADSALIAVLPMLVVVRWGKTLENSTDYSLNNTVRNMLWLPTTREMKYQAKQAVDTFFVRMGDVGSALTVFIIATALAGAAAGARVRTVAIINAVLVGIWLFVAVLILRERRKMLELRAKETGNEPDPERQPLTGRDIGVLVFVIALIGVNAYSLINEWGLMFWGLLFP